MHWRCNCRGHSRAELTGGAQVLSDLWQVVLGGPLLVEAVGGCLGIVWMLTLSHCLLFVQVVLSDLSLVEPRQPKCV
jgi:hypothetical protein